MAIIFSDAFNRTNATTLGSPWTSYGGATAGIDNNQAYGIVSVGDDGFVGYDSGKSDCVISGTFSNIYDPNDWGCSLIFRASSARTFFHFQVAPFGWSLEFVNNGGWTTISENSSRKAASGDRVVITLNGSSINITINGTPHTSVTSTLNQNATIHGLQFGDHTGTLGNRFDDFEIKDDTPDPVGGIQLYTKVGGVLKTYDKGWVKVSGVLREIDSIKTKVSGVLKDV